jgi:rhodanese-related sulfurtransferase
MVDMQKFPTIGISIFVWVASLWFISGESEGQHESEPRNVQRLIDRVKQMNQSFLNNEFLVKDYIAPNGKRLLKEETVLKFGDSPIERYRYLKRYDPEQKNPKLGTQYSEAFIGGGQAVWLTKSDYGLSPYYLGAVGLRDSDIPPLVSPISSVLFFGKYQGVDSQRSIVGIADPTCKYGLQKGTAGQGPKLIVSKNDSKIEFHFDTDAVNVITIGIESVGTRKKFTGVYGDDGRPILELRPYTLTLEFRDIVWNQDSTKVVSGTIGGIADGKFKESRQREFKFVKRLHGFDGTPFKFEKIKQPDTTSVVIKGTDAEYKLREGRIVRLVDKSAAEVIDDVRKELKSSEKETQQDKVKTPDCQQTDDDVVLEDYLRISSARHCGVYSAVIASELLGKRCDLKSLNIDEFISTNRGSSAQDIINFLKMQGLHGFVTTNADTSLFPKIDQSGGVAILHFGGSFQAEKIAHWAVFKEVDANGDVCVIDLPRNEESMSNAEILTEWDGTAIVVTNSPVDWKTRFLSQSGFLTTIIASISVALLGLLLVKQIPSLKKLNPMTTLIVVALAFSVVWWIASPLSYHNNPKAVKLVQAKTTPTSVLDEIETLEELTLDSGTAIVDARLPSSFSRGHVPNAVNLPADYSIGELNQALTALKGKSKIVVYCRSDQCGWAKLVAAKLKTFDLPGSIAVYEPGFVGFQQAESVRNAE